MILLLGLAAALAGCNGYIDPEPSSVEVVVKESGDWHRSGSGFFVDEDTVATCKHVAVKDKSPAYKAVGVKIGDKVFEARFIRTSILEDLALLDLDEKHGTPVKLGNDAKLGDEVWGTGFPLDYEKLAFFGRVTGSRRDSFTRGHSRVSFDALVNPGHSGSAVMTKAGEVVGMVTSLDNRPVSGGLTVRGISFFMPVSAIKREMASL